MKLRVRIWEVLTAKREKDRVGTVVNIALIALIMINVTGFILQTVDSINRCWEDELRWLEIISASIFTVELLLRYWSCGSDRRYRGWRGLLRYMITPMAAIDLLALLPFYLPFSNVDFRALRVLRMFRVVRLLRFGRYHSSLNLFYKVFINCKEELIMTSAMMVALLLISSSLIYFAENDAQPQAFSSIPAAMWWAAITLTTVGYGDIAPVTHTGKLLGALVAIFGVGMFALPVSIFGAGFIEEIRKRKRRIDEATRRCPHCGKLLSEDGEEHSD